MAAAATVAGISAAAILLPRVAHLVTGTRAGLIFAVLLGTAYGAGFHTHVRTPTRGFRWAALGAGAVLLILFQMHGGAP